MSIGLARSTNLEITTPKLLAAVDRALYRAKRLRRDRVEVEMPDRRPAT